LPAPFAVIVTRKRPSPLATACTSTVAAAVHAVGVLVAVGLGMSVMAGVGVTDAVGRTVRVSVTVLVGVTLAVITLPTTTCRVGRATSFQSSASDDEKYFPL